MIDYCSVADCTQPAVRHVEALGGAALCSTHQRQWTRRKALAPIQPRSLSPRARLLEAAIRVADHDTEATTDAQFERELNRLEAQALAFATARGWHSALNCPAANDNTESPEDRHADGAT